MHRIRAGGTTNVQCHTRAFHFSADFKGKKSAIADYCESRKSSVFKIG